MKKIFEYIWKVLSFPFAILFLLIIHPFTIRPAQWLMQRRMLKEARRIANEVTKEYAKSKSKYPNAPEKQVIMRIASDDEYLSQIHESSRERIEVCCETIQGLCYMMALDFGRLKGLINIRSLQFIRYMDKALELQGFPHQSKEQKGRILEVMDL